MNDFESSDRSQFSLLPRTMDGLPNTSTPLIRRQQQKRQRMGSDQCPRCENTINTNSITYTCCVCDLAYCFECTNVSRALHEAISEDPDTNFKWTCNSCKQNFPSINNIKQSFQTLDQKSDARMSSIEDKIDRININVTTTVKEQVHEMKKDVVKEVTDQIMENISTEIRTEIKEIEEQKLRAMNLMVYNLEESKETETDQKKSDDIARFRTVCSSLNIENVEIKFAIRIGSIIEGSSRIRPLKIILENKKTRKDIVDNSRHIRQNAPGILKKIIIAKDLTWKQRESNKARLMQRRRDAATNRPPYAMEADETVIGGITTENGASGVREAANQNL